MLCPDELSPLRAAVRIIAVLQIKGIWPDLNNNANYVLLNWFVGTSQGLKWIWTTPQKDTFCYLFRDVFETLRQASLSLLGARNVPLPPSPAIFLPFHLLFFLSQPPLGSFARSSLDEPARNWKTAISLLGVLSISVKFGLLLSIAPHSYRQVLDHTC